MYLKVAPNGNIYRRKEISGWFSFPTSHQAALVYIDATMIYDGSILAISAAGQLHLLATPSGLPENMNHNLASQPHSVAALLDGSVLVLTVAGTLHRAEFPRGPWTQLTLPNGAAPIDIAVTPGGRLLYLTAAGAIHQAGTPGVPGQGTVWAPMVAPALVNVQRIEFLHDGSLIGIDNANAPHLLPADQINANGAWQPLQNVGPILSVTQLGGHTLLAIDQANHFMTADALPENWVPVAGPGVPVRALAHLPTGHVAALGNNGQIYRAPFTHAGLQPFAPYIAAVPPVPLISMTANRGGKIIVVGNDHQLYTWETTNGPPGWSHLNTGPTQLCSVTFLDDDLTLYGIDQNQTDRHICWPDQTSTWNQTAPWTRIGTDVAVTCASRIKDGSILEVTVAGNTLYRKPSLQADLVSCGWAGPCIQVIELATDPADTQPRTTKWLLQYSSADPDSEHGDGRPWGDGTRMALRARNRSSNPWDPGSRVTPLIGGFAALSAMRDAFEAAIIEANASNDPPGQRGYVYIADWLLTPLRDLSEDNPWGGGSWTTQHQATRDQTAIGLIARMMSAGIKVRVLVWMPTTIQAREMGPHARQHWYLACMVQELNNRLKAQGGPWANADFGVVALDLRTAPVLAVSLHQKMCVVRVGEVNVGFCGGVDLAYTRRDFRRPADSIIGAGDWQSGDLMPVINNGWPGEQPAPLCGYPTIPGEHPQDVIADELGKDVYGTIRHWHDQHLKVEGPIVTSLEAQFDERWRVPGRPFVFQPNSNYGNDNQVQFTSAEAFGGETIQPLWVTACDPVGSAVVQLWRTIPVDNRRRQKSPFGRGEFTVMAGICNAIQQATQLITIWDQYFWSEPLSLLLAERLKRTVGLKVLIVLPPYGSNSPQNELWFRRRALQTLWKSLLTPENRARVMVLNTWSHLLQVGVYVHAKVQTYDDCLVVCGSANMNRRSFTVDMELDCAVLHKPDVSYHLANLAHMLTGQPWLDFDHGWLQRFWTHITANAGQTTIPDPFYCDPGQIGVATPNGVQYVPGGFTPELIVEPTTVNSGTETADAQQFRGSPGATGRLDQIVWLLERYTEKGGFVYRYPK
jgi:phosphatidylserine/phosphatidylglycerophosphate/cardiolipin synthase-like enzyme